MDRATFEKIVGGGQCVFGDVEILEEHLPDITPFRLRCLLHGLGIKCDWDAEVTFERLTELDGAWSNDSKQVVAFEKPGKFNELWFELIEGFWWLTEVSTSRQVVEITTMRQVHLLLEAAEVGG